ncbi:IS66 family insertion sequence element accessory protein TnpA [Paenibacillus azoreducens]|uniref:IS66 family insertion sequence element accessory protein TnpA n=1 Tax=Paenibacillus azoreducens TaxID=116718 RepID=UPI0039F475C1
MAAWCAAHQCSIDKLKYWLYKSKRTSPSATLSSSPTWVPLYVVNSGPDAATRALLVVRESAKSLPLFVPFL